MIKKLIGNKCFLSPFEESDAESWVRWFNDLEVCLPLGDEAYLPTSLELEREGLRKWLNERKHGFSIYSIGDNILIGRALLLHVNHIDRTAMVGIVLGEKEYWNIGIGREAMELILDYGFSILNLHNIMLSVYSFNQRAMKVYENIGFKEMGKRREARIIGNKKYSIIFMDLLSTEFESPFIKELMKKI